MKIERTSEPYDDWYETYRAQATHDKPWHTAWSQLELKVIRESTKSTLKVPLSAEVDGSCIGGAMIELPLLDNLGLAIFNLWVHPDQWASGAGEALLTACEQVAQQEGRSKLVSWLPYPLGEEPEADPEVALLLSNGFEQTLTEQQRALDLPVATSAVTEQEGYRIVPIVNRPDPEIGAGLRALWRIFDTEAPSGIDFEPAVIDDEVEDARWARFAAIDRTVLTTVAISPEGEVAAYTEINVPHTGDWAFQDATLVAKAHRGHGLGMAIKQTNLAALQRLFPEKRSVRTWNAGDNEWMVSINRTLGYREVESMAELVKTL